ncbi:MAG: hypothetical protein AAFN08_04225 [Cyanobacteria bacterium J06559_3]
MPEEHPLEEIPAKRLSVLYGAFTQGVGRGIRNWMALAFAGYCATGGTALVALLTLVSVPAEVDCKADRQAISDRDALTCLQAAIATGDSEEILTAIDWVGSWGQSHPLYNEVQGLLGSWSATVLLTAQHHRAEGQLAEAITLIQRIPPASPLYTDARSLLEEMQGEQKLHELISYEAGQEALQQRDWAQAFKSLWHLQALATEPSETRLSRKLSQQIEAERQAQRLLNEAIHLYSLGEMQTRGKAIAIASQIDTSTYVWESVQPLLDDWSDELLSAGRNQIAQGNFAKAASILKKVVPNPSRRMAAQDWLAQAQAAHLAQTRAKVVATVSSNTISAQTRQYPTLLTAQSIQPENAREILTSKRYFSSEHSGLRLSPEIQHEPIFNKAAA